MDRPRIIALALVSLGLAWASGVGAGETRTEAITRPCEERNLSFVNPGRIAMMAVRAGDAVKVGQVLARQDTTVEEIQAEQLKAKAEDTIRVDAQDARLKQTEVDLRKFEEAEKRGAATKLEVEHARLEVVIARLSLQLAKFDQEQAKRDHHVKVQQIAQMELRSPIDGVVAEVYRGVGEEPDTPKPWKGKKFPAKGVLRVVKIDPLWIDVNAPNPVAGHLRKGQTVKVRFRASRRPGKGPEPAGPVQDGKIIFIAPEWDAASNTRIVRVEVPNPGGRRAAGENVTVCFQTDSQKADTVTAAQGTDVRTGGTRE